MNRVGDPQLGNFVLHCCRGGRKFKTQKRDVALPRDGDAGTYNYQQAVAVLDILRSPLMASALASVASSMVSQRSAVSASSAAVAAAGADTDAVMVARSALRSRGQAFIAKYMIRLRIFYLQLRQ